MHALFRTFLLLSLSLLSFLSFAQKEKIEQLLKTAAAVYNSNPDSSMFFCEEAEKLSKEQNLAEQHGLSFLCEARYVLLKGDLKVALEKINAAIAELEPAGSKRGLGKAYSLKSIVMGKLGNHDERITFLAKSKEFFLAAKDSEGFVTSTVNLANAYNEAGEPDKALALLNDLLASEYVSHQALFYVELNYGNACLIKKDLPAACSHLKKSVAIAQQLKMVDSEVTALTKLGECYYQLGDRNEAIRNLNTALQIAKINKLPVEETDILKSLVQILEENKDYGNAFQDLKRLKFLQDSLMNMEKLKSIHAMENKLKLAEKEKIIAEQDFALEKENAELASSRFRGILLTGGILVLIAAFIFLFVFLKRTQKLYSLIRTQKREVEHQKEELETKNREITDSINYARYIQNGMLPSEKKINRLFPENFILYRPKDIVAGDFYWVEETHNGKALLAACDCTGHGVPGAMVSIVACNALVRAVKEFKLASPEKILDKVSQLMEETFSVNEYEIKDGMDAVLCSYDRENQVLEIAAANNPLWIAGVSSTGLTSGMEIFHIAPDKRPVGRSVEESRPFELKTVHLKKGEILYLFSDGYADQFGGPKGKKFKYKQLEELLLSICELPMEEQRKTLNRRLDEWRGNLDQVDDILVIGVRI